MDGIVVGFIIGWIVGIFFVLIVEDRIEHWKNK